MDADFTLKLGATKSNAFSVVADFVSKGIFKDDAPRAQNPRKSVEKLRVFQPQVEGKRLAQNILKLTTVR